MVGLLTFLTIGAAVLWDLWGILDIKKGHTMVSRSEVSTYYCQHSLSRSKAYFCRHFAARAFGLIVFPFVIYLAIFYVHFSILIYSGPGDTFMSPAFQETLKGNELLLNAQGA